MKKISAKILAFAVATGLIVACSSRQENSSQSTPDSNSVETVAPSADGTPTDGSSPSNPGSPPDSAAQATDQDSTLRR